MLALAGIGRPRAMRRTPSAAVRNAMTHSRVATRKSSGRLTRYTIQKLPVIWFPNDWTATSPSNSRYRKRCETRNGGGAGGAETIRYAARRANVQRDFDARVASRFESRESSLPRESQQRPTMIRVAFRLARRRGQGLEETKEIFGALRIESSRGDTEPDPNGERLSRK